MRNDLTGKIPIPAPVSGRPDYGADGLSGDEPAVLPIGMRMLWGMAAIAAFSLLLLAAYLRPAGEGLGTHQQLGLPPCGWIMAADMPCPSCGMTTAFSHAADGNLLGSFRAQPMGALLALVTAVIVIAAGWTALSGSRLGPFLFGLMSARIGWAILVFALLAWIWKIIDHKGIL